MLAATDVGEDAVAGADSVPAGPAGGEADGMAASGADAAGGASAAISIFGCEAIAVRAVSITSAFGRAGVGAAASCAKTATREAETTTSPATNVLAAAVLEKRGRFLMIVFSNWGRGFIT